MHDSSDTQLIANRYELHEKLGSGGMGTVFRATDRLTGQIVALKRVTDLADTPATEDTADTTGFRLALAREFKTLASLRHPHIINVLDYGFDQDRLPYFTMEYLQDPLDFANAAQDQTYDKQIDLIVHLLQAIAYLHRRGILHRDLKPANVLITSEGVVKVLDFGLAIERDEIDKEDQVAGTLSYMAPELFMGDLVSRASDLYSAGVMMYEILAGQHPFQHTMHQPNGLITAILSEDPDIAPVEAWEEGYKSHRAGGAAVHQTTRSRLTNPDEPTVTGVEGQMEDTVAFDYDDAQLQQTAQYGLIARSDGDEDSIEVLWDSVNTEGWGGSSMLAMTISRLLLKDADLRYDDAYEVLNDLVTALGRTLQQESRAIRESFLQAATFVGRQRELDQLTAALEAILDGENAEGSLWLVSGESGVGKTRLLDELRNHALVEGVVVLHGQAVEGVGKPYQSWREPLRRLLLHTDVDDIDASILSDIVPEINQLLRRDVQPPPDVADTDYAQRLSGTIASVFQRQTQPVLLLLEDLQWAGQSLEMLQVLNQMVSHLPVLIVGSYRNDERPDLPDDLPGANVLRLDRLTPEQILELSVSMVGEVGSQADVQEFLAHETEGNVFFIVEVVRSLAEEAGRLEDIGRIALPQTVMSGGIERIVNRRLERVASEDHVLLRIAAAAGRELDLDILKSVIAQNTHPDLTEINLEQWLTNLSNIGVLEVIDGTWRFSHDKLRQSMLSDITTKDEPEVNRAVALALEAVYPGAKEHLRALANHWRLAGNAEKELRYSKEAGDDALHTGGFNRAVEYYERALALLAITSGNNQPAEADIRIKLGEALENHGDYPAARTHLQTALSIGRELDEPGIIGYALVGLGDVAWRQGQYSEAIEVCEESLGIFQTLDDRRGMALAQNRIGNIYYEQGAYDDAVNYWNDSIENARSSDFQEIVASATNNLGMAAFALGQYDDAHDYFLQTLEMTQQSGERRKIAIANLNLGVIAGEKRDYEPASQHMYETLRICEEIGERRGVGLALRNLGGLARYAGDYQEATVHLEESLQLYRELGEQRSIAQVLVELAHAERESGDVQRAEEIYREGLQLAHEIDIAPITVEILAGLGSVLDDKVQGLTLMGLAINNPSMFDNMRNEMQPLLDQLMTELPEDEANAAYERGKSLDLATVVGQVLAGEPV